MNNSHLKGVVPIVITPLCPNGDIDQKSCKNVVNYLIDNGASALFILGSASEGFLLDIDQRIEVIRAMSEANNSRVPIIAGCSYMAPKMVFEFFRRVANEKIQGLHFIPEDIKIGEDRLVALLNKYADESPFPMYLYHNIKRGRAITNNVVLQVKKHPNIVGMKVGGYDQEEMKCFLRAEDEGFQILGSGGGQFLSWLELGASAVTASSACCFPKLFADMYQDYKLGNSDSAQEKQKLWIEFHKRIPNTAPDNGEYAAEEKYVLKKLGVIESDHCHFPYRDLSPEEKNTIDLVMDDLGKIILG